MGVRKVSAKVTFKVIDDHWQWRHWCHTIFIATMSLTCNVSEILSLIFQNLKRSRHIEHIPFGGNLSRMH